MLVDGAMAGLWKGRKQGKRLEVSVEWLGAEADVAEEAAAMAALRDCEEPGAQNSCMIAPIETLRSWR